MSRRSEIKLAGVGGQGVVLAGTIIGCAASVYDHINAVQTKEYGSELRGGDVSTGVIVSDEKIIFPSVISPDVLIVLAQQAFESTRHLLKPGATLLTDSDQVQVDAAALPEGVKHIHAPFNAIADREFHQNTVLNMITLGFFSAKTGIISVDALRQAVAMLVPPKSKEQNLKAVERGIEWGSEPQCR